MLSLSVVLLSGFVEAVTGAVLRIATAVYHWKNPTKVKSTSF